MRENCKCKGGGRVGRGPGHPSRSPKAIIGMNVVHSGSLKRCGAAESRLERDYRKEKEKSSFQVLGRSSVEAFGLRF